MLLLMNFLYKKSTYKYLFWLWVVFILVVTLIPKIKAPEIDIEKFGFKIHLDYVVHFIFFFVLTTFFFLWKAHEFKKRKSIIILFVFLSILYATVTEMLHLFLPNRTFNILDLILNISGILSAMLLI
ncbi:MAG: VanZ family protein, partial [Bacteroidota bacterium]|nr:VanZ family protein [Bacteroidota bacterium]